MLVAVVAMVNSCKYHSVLCVNLNLANHIVGNKTILSIIHFLPFKVVRNSFPFSITTEIYERFTRL